MADFNNYNHLFYNRIAGNTLDDSLPIQTIPFSQKDKNWGKQNMDRLESIAISQLSRNIAFTEYRDMYHGRLVLADFDETIGGIGNDIKDFRQEYANLPTFIKHFDIIGIIVNQLSGEFDKQKDIIRVDSIDSFSQSEFLREKNTLIRKYTEDYFNLELQRLLVLKGVNPAGQNFETEEQRQAYAQQLEQQKAELIPPEQIQNNLQKSFRTIISEWANRTLKSDYIKYDLADADLEELVDYLLTGRYFRGYRLGYNFYEPEVGKNRWIPETTFFSQDPGLVYPQDGEYVGRILYVSGSDIIEKYGHLLSHKVTKNFYGYNIKADSTDGVSIEASLKRGFSENHIVPDKSYYQRDLAYSYQTATGFPMGETIKRDVETGGDEARLDWVDLNRRNYLGNGYAQLLRKDIQVRHDLLQVTEAYWKSTKMVGLLTIPNPITGEPYQIIVEESLMKDYLKENNIKQTKTVSAEEARDKKELNTVAWFNVPQVWQGKKINAGNSNLSEDIYFDIKPMPFQIRGQGDNLFSVLLPVAGIITSSIAQKIRPYQIEYNIAMNQIRNSMEKHIGAFLMFDYNFLPSQYKSEDSGDAQDLLLEFTQNIKDLGFGFTDKSPANTAGQNPNAQSVEKHSISFVEDMQYYSAMADKYKALAYEQIGVTPQRLGTASEYHTAEGIKQGVDASYAQTERIYKRFNSAKRKEALIHLSIAQYAVKDTDNITIDYLDADEGRVIRKFTDKDFNLRKLDVHPTNDSEQRKNLETFRAALFNNNTIDNDMLDYAKIIGSKSFKALMDHAIHSRKLRQQQVEATRQHEQSMQQQAIQAKQLEKQQDQAFLADQNQKDRDTDLREAEILAIAKVADNNADASFIEEIKRTADENLRASQAEEKLDIQRSEVKRKEDKDAQEFQMHLKKLNLEAEKLKLRKEENDTKRFTSIINKN